jgi:hypothetical protein
MNCHRYTFLQIYDFEHDRSLTPTKWFGESRGTWMRHCTLRHPGTFDSVCHLLCYAVILLSMHHCDYRQVQGTHGYRVDPSLRDS